MCVVGVGFVFSLHSSYLTDSTNSPINSYFVDQHQLCGEVSYSLYENEIVAYEINFTNVQDTSISRIRTDFNHVIAM